MNKTIRWGIIGPGNIAHKFAQDLLLVEGAELIAVASRQLDRAEDFARQYGVTHSYGSYLSLAEDPAIDIIYISTPHVFHFENTMMCLRAGKSVLCEKPFGMNTHQVQAMVEEASIRGLFLMEAMWTRFIPATEKILQLIQNDTIGQIRHISADFGHKADKGQKHRLFDKHLGGGSLLDIGIYPVYLSLLLLGIPNRILAMATMTEEAVDSFCCILFDYIRGQKAVLESSLESSTPTEARVHGSQGSIILHRNFHHTEKISLLNEAGELIEIFEVPYVGMGYYHEIIEVMNCLKSGKLESDKMPHTMSLSLIKSLDEIRSKIGLNYEADQ